MKTHDLKFTLVICAALTKVALRLGYGPYAYVLRYLNDLSKEEIYDAFGTTSHYVAAVIVLRNINHWPKA